VQTIATPATNLNLRFPRQWFQLETGSHYNWHRNYDPTTRRNLRPDPLGFVDDWRRFRQRLSDYSDRDHIVSGQRRADSWYHGNSKGFCSRVAARRAEHLWLCEVEHDRLGQELRENVAFAGADGHTKTDFMGALGHRGQGNSEN
jgi:RHS repeat-associated protein